MVKYKKNRQIGLKNKKTQFESYIYLIIVYVWLNSRKESKDYKRYIYFVNTSS